jgi:hypothetical protein
MFPGLAFMPTAAKGLAQADAVRDARSSAAVSAGDNIVFLVLKYRGKMDAMIATQLM